MIDFEQLPAIEMHSHIIDPAGIALMRQERLSYALIMHPDNCAAMEAARQNRDLLGALAWLNPTKPGWRDEAVRLLAQYPDMFKGFKIHPDMDHFQVSLDLLAPMFELANKHGLMIQSHTNDQSGNCRAGLFAPIMEAFPETMFLAIHGCPGEEAFALVKAYANVYIDTSYTAWGRAYQQRALAAVGKERIVMGLDSPLGFPEREKRIQPHFRDAIREICAFYDNDPEVAEHVMHRNARRILGL